MSVLSPKELRARIYLEDPQDSKRIFIVPAPSFVDIKNDSIDLFLGNHFIVTKSARFSALEARSDYAKKDVETTGVEKNVASYQEKVLVPFEGQLVIHPGSLILGVTWQYIGLPKDIHAQVVARSTWGRAGLTVATAVVVHPGFVGCLTLELVNNGNAPITLYPGARVAQIVFMTVEPTDTSDTVSVSKYCGMTEPAFTKLHEEAAELERWKKIGESVSFKKKG